MLHNLSNIECNKIKQSYHYTHKLSLTLTLSLSLSLSHTYIKDTDSNYRGLSKLKFSYSVMRYTTRKINF